jgi:hypothetical protein
MPVTEWVNTQQNVPHKFISDAYSALQLARVQRSDGAGGLWGPIDASGRVGQPYAKPAAGVWPPVYPSLSEWTVDNVFVGNYSLREMFLADSDFLPGPVTPPAVYPPPIAFPDPVIETLGPGAGGPAPLIPVIPGADEAITHIDGDVIGSRLLAFAKYPGAPAAETVFTKSLYEIAALLEQGYGLLRQDGTLAAITEFMGGVLADGEPLTVWLGRGWLPGQQQALIDAGIIPVTDLGKVFSQGPSPLLVGGAIAAAVFLFMRRKK